MEELSFRVDELEREVRVLEKFSLPKMQVPNVSQEEQLKAKILAILSAREQLTISELQSLTGVGWKKLYEALKELEKENKVSREKKKRKVVVKLTNKR